jgi:hypothetical protein
VLTRDEARHILANIGPSCLSRFNGYATGFSIDISVLFAIAVLNAFGRRRCKNGWSKPRLYDDEKSNARKRVAYGRESHWQISRWRNGLPKRRAGHRKRSDVRKATSNSRRPADGAMNARTTSHSAWSIG